MSRPATGIENPSLVGRSVPRQDAREKVTGAAAYVADLHLPGMLHGRALRAEYPHARILAIDPRAAREQEGVAAVLTAADVPGVNRFGRVTADQPVLADGKVRYLGDVVALVAAETPEAAERALGLVRVRYEPLPAVFDPLEAMAEGAPEVHDGRNNVLAHVKVRKGDVDAAFAAAEVVVEGTYTTPTVDHLYLEPEGAVAVPAPDGSLTVWAPTQAPFAVRAAVANALGLPAHRVKVIQTTAGGGFGGKVDAAMDTCARAALLAQATGRPVRLIYGRRESLLGSGKRHAAAVRHRLAASRDGRLLGVDIQVYLNKGAYASVGGVEPPAGGLTVKSAVHAAGPYEIPNVRVDVYNVYTNLPYGSPMRGYGVPQVCFATESQVDDLAHRLGMDPLELRRLNGFQPGSTTATGQVLDQSVGYQETLHRAAEAAGWSGGRRPEAPRPGTGRRAGGNGGGELLLRGQFRPRQRFCHGLHLLDRRGPDRSADGPGRAGTGVPDGFRAIRGRGPGGSPGAGQHTGARHGRRPRQLDDHRLAGRHPRRERRADGGTGGAADPGAPRGCAGGPGGASAGRTGAAPLPRRPAADRPGPVAQAHPEL